MAKNKKKNIWIWIVVIIAVLYLAGQHEKFAIITNPSYIIEKVVLYKDDPTKDYNSVNPGTNYKIDVLVDTIYHDRDAPEPPEAKIECGIYPLEQVQSWGYLMAEYPIYWYPSLQGTFGQRDTKNCVAGEANVGTVEIVPKLGVESSFRRSATFEVTSPSTSGDFVLFCEIFEYCWSEVKDTTQDIRQHSYIARTLSRGETTPVTRTVCCKDVVFETPEKRIGSCKTGEQEVSMAECEKKLSPIDCSPTITSADLADIRGKTSTENADWVKAHQCTTSTDCCDHPDSECIVYDEASTSWQKFWDWGDNDYGYCITKGSKYCAWAEGWAPKIFGQDACASATIILIIIGVIFMFMLILITRR